MAHCDFVWPSTAETFEPNLTRPSTTCCGLPDRRLVEQPAGVGPVISPLDVGSVCNLTLRIPVLMPDTKAGDRWAVGDDGVVAGARRRDGTGLAWLLGTIVACGHHCRHDQKSTCSHVAP